MPNLLSARNATNNGLVPCVANKPPDDEYLDGPPRPNDVCVRHAHERVVRRGSMAGKDTLAAGADNYCAPVEISEL